MQKRGRNNNMSNQLEISHIPSLLSSAFFSSKNKQLIKMSTFTNSHVYKRYFCSLLFFDIRAKLEGVLFDQWSNGNIYDILPIINFGHRSDFAFEIVCKRHILERSTNNTLVLIIFDDEIESSGELPVNHLLGRLHCKMFDRGKKKIAISIAEKLNDERIENFKFQFDKYLIDNESSDHRIGKKRSFSIGCKMRLLFLESVQSRIREANAICNIDRLQLSALLLNPQSMIEQKQMKSRIWSELPFGFKQRLQQNLNESQRMAVEKACKHNGIILLQGPPGTGKTRTVLYCLNAFLLSRANYMYKSWINNIYEKSISRAKQTQQRSSFSAYTLEDILLDVSQQAQMLEENAQVMRHPRLLVCAPSNNAVDEIVERVMKQKFVDGHGIAFSPKIVRIGISDKFRDTIFSVTLDAVANAFLNHRYGSANGNSRKNEFDEKRNLREMRKRVEWFKGQKNYRQKKLETYVKLSIHTFCAISYTL